jgi:hypothetical protein
MGKSETKLDREIDQLRHLIRMCEKELSGLRGTDRDLADELIEAILSGGDRLRVLKSTKNALAELPQPTRGASLPSGMGKEITDVLNDDPSSPAAQRVSKVLSLAVEGENLRLAIQETAAKDGYRASPMIPKVLPERFRASELRDKAKRYRQIVDELQEIFVASRWSISIFPQLDRIRVVYSEALKKSDWESESVATIFSLLERHGSKAAPVIHFRRCKYASCRKWMFCKSLKRVFCDSPCRFNFHNKTVEGRRIKRLQAKKRREDERKRYAAQPKGSGLRVQSSTRKRKG